MTHMAFRAKELLDLELNRSKDYLESYVVYFILVESQDVQTRAWP